MMLLGSESLLKALRQPLVLVGACPRANPLSGALGDPCGNQGGFYSFVTKATYTYFRRERVLFTVQGEKVLEVYFTATRIC